MSGEERLQADLRSRRGLPGWVGDTGIDCVTGGAVAVCLFLWESDDQWLPVCGVGCGSKVFGGVEGSSVQVVDADGVAAGVDDGEQAGFEGESLGWRADDFEDRFLDSVSYAFAGLGDLSEPSFAVGCGGVDVVGDEEFHQVIVQGW
jgi:hypothetical protein